MCNCKCYYFRAILDHFSIHFQTFLGHFGLILCCVGIQNQLKITVKKVKLGYFNQFFAFVFLCACNETDNRIFEGLEIACRQMDANNITPTQCQHKTLTRTHTRDRKSTHSATINQLASADKPREYFASAGASWSAGSGGCGTAFRAPASLGAGWQWVSWGRLCSSQYSATCIATPREPIDGVREENGMK